MRAGGETEWYVHILQLVLGKIYMYRHYMKAKYPVANFLLFAQRVIRERVSLRCLWLPGPGCEFRPEESSPWSWRTRVPCNPAEWWPSGRCKSPAPERGRQVTVRPENRGPWRWARIWLALVCLPAEIQKSYQKIVITRCQNREKLFWRCRGTCEAKFFASD